MRRELTNQELLDRYIHAVRLMLMLPPGAVDDVAAEVRSNLESQMDDRARTLGRELRPEEVSAMLKQYGHPAKVAQQYREQPGRALIGPTLFPFYWFTLRAILAVWLTIRLIVAVFTLQGTSATGTILLALGRDVLLAALIIPSGVTLLFAAWEYLETRFRYSERWKPEALPPVPPPVPKPPTPRPMVHVIGGIAWLIFLALALYSPSFFWVWGARGAFSASDALDAVRLPVLLLAFAALFQSWLGYTRFAGCRWRQVLRVIVVTAGVALAAFLLTTGDLLIAGPQWSPAQARSLGTLNQMIAGVLMLVCILAGLAVLRAFFRILRRSSGHSRTAHLAS